jgi:DNA-binding CsgD family transcriptional regulator
MHKSNDLANSTMNLIRKNEILIDIKNELGKLADNMRNDNHKEYAKKLQHVMTQINENIEHDNDWKKFEENFDNIHQNFMKRLGEQYKGLTMSDKKLCAYLKMNLVSKDIAPLLNISIRGVEISRYRLRKKLNLERDVNLTDFLQNF